MKINTVSATQNQNSSYEHIVSKSADHNAGTTGNTVKGTQEPAPIDTSVQDIQKKEKDPINDELLKESIEQANKALLMYGKYIEREVHEVTHAIMYTIKDSKTNEVIQEFPPKRLQDMIAKMWELAGLFVDERV